MKQVTSTALWWTTPVLMLDNLDSEDFNAGLRRIILAKEDELVRSGSGEPVAGLEDGLTTRWRDYNVLNWEYPECRILRRIVMNGARDFIALVGNPDDPGLAILGIASWGNVLRHGQSLHIHHHDQAFMNAHYIVDSGHGPQESQGGDSGHTVYYRPGFIERSHGERRGETRNPWDEGWRVSTPARPGALTFFPSYVRHEVRPHLGPMERISIAFDFYVRKQDPLIHFSGPMWFIP